MAPLAAVLPRLAFRLLVTATVCVCAALARADDGAFAARPAPAMNPSPGDAPGFPLRLAVDAPDGCADRASFWGRIASYRARIRDARPDEGSRSMFVEFRPSGGEVLGELTVREVDGREGHREVRGADCESVASGLALVAAVIVDPAAVRVLQGMPDPDPNALPSPAPTPPSAGADLGSPASAGANLGSASEAGPAHGSPWRLSAGAAVEVAAGLGPDPQTLPRLFLDARLPGWLQRVSGRASVGRGFSTSVNTAIGTASLVLTDVRIEPCADVLSRPTLRFAACGIAEVDVLEGNGTKTTAASSASRTSFELGLGVRPGWVLGDRVEIDLFVGGAVPLGRYRFYFSSPDTTAYALPPWSALAELSAGVRFW